MWDLIIQIPFKGKDYTIYWVFIGNLFDGLDSNFLPIQLHYKNGFLLQKASLITVLDGKNKKLKNIDRNWMPV